MDKQKWIEELGLTEHVEGGWYNLCYTSNKRIENGNGAQRPSATSIYFLLEAGNFSAFHRLQADEIWYYHCGSPFHIIGIDLKGKLHHYHLGKNIEVGEKLQVVIPKGWIFGSYVEKEFGIVGCMVTPGFEYADFELFTAQALLEKYPEHHEMINKLTRK
ncbi:MAG: cupin domain-containing protein [Culicoidibacterales bacterium]